MNREQLRMTLAAEGVQPAAYGLDGERGDETCVLERQAIGWSVFYSERGLRTGERFFADEAAACEHLLGLLLRDPTTRRY